MDIVREAKEPESFDESSSMIFGNAGSNAEVQRALSAISLGIKCFGN
jgi:hypothetical protein